MVTNAFIYNALKIKPVASSVMTIGYDVIDW